MLDSSVKISEGEQHETSSNITGHTKTAERVNNLLRLDVQDPELLMVPSHCSFCPWLQQKSSMRENSCGSGALEQNTWKMAITCSKWCWFLYILRFFPHIQGFKSNQGLHVILVALICSINIEPFRKNRESKKLNLAPGLRVTSNSATLKFTREEPPSGLLTLRITCDITCDP